MRWNPLARIAPEIEGVAVEVDTSISELFHVELSLPITIWQGSPLQPQCVRRAVKVRRLYRKPSVSKTEEAGRSRLAAAVIVGVSRYAVVKDDMPIIFRGAFRCIRGCEVAVPRLRCSAQWKLVLFNETRKACPQSQQIASRHCKTFGISRTTSLQVPCSMSQLHACLWPQNRMAGAKMEISASVPLSSGSESYRSSGITKTPEPSTSLT